MEKLVATLDVEDPAALAASSARERVVAWANWGVRNAGPIHYSQRRPIDGLDRPGKLPLNVDCSGWVTCCYRWGGAIDPNGNGYNGSGYTGTLMRYCRRIKEEWLRPGDLVTFGAFPGTHVVIMVGSGPNGLCVSHGQEKGPLRYALSVAKGALSGPVMAWRSPTLPLGPWATRSDDPHFVDEAVLPALTPGERSASNPPEAPEGSEL